MDPMSALANRAYAKMNGLGNDILVVDLRGGSEPGDAAQVVDAAQVRALALAPGFSFDQLMAVHAPRSPGTEAFVLIYNADGSTTGACGNGSRCVAWFLLRGGTRVDVAFETEGGLIACHRLGAWQFSADMGRPRLDWTEIPVRAAVPDTRSAAIALGASEAALGPASLVSMGNPHAIFWVEDFAKFDLARIGPLLERHPDFPERANISLAKIVSRDHIALKVWERGAGLTKACGTAACAAVVAASRLGRSDRRARVSLPGGDLCIDWGEDDHVRMTGPCALEREGRLNPEAFGADGKAAIHVAS